MNKLLILITLLTFAFSQDVQLYTCGMHPHILEKQPGKCPICKMDLTPVRKGQEKSKIIKYWRAPMDPNEIYDKPGKSKMGMDLVPVYENASPSSDLTIQISPDIKQSIGLISEHPQRREINKQIETNGVVQFDQSKVHHVTLKVDGWIEMSAVTYEGQSIRKGDLLLKVYSPEAVAAQQEFLSALQTAKILSGASKQEAMALQEAAKKRLQLWGIDQQQIQAIQNKQQVSREILIRAPFSGVVNKLKINHGHFVKKGEMIMEIADLSQLWLLVDIYEKDLPFIQLNDPITATLPYDPGRTYNGYIDYIYPVLDEQTRSVKARILVRNKDAKLKVNMIASVQIKPVGLGRFLTIPADALIKTGKRNLVIIDHNDGSYSPREIQTGIYFNRYYQVIEGLSESDLVVTSGQFLLDSESKLQATIQKLINAKIWSEGKND